MSKILLVSLVFLLSCTEEKAPSETVGDVKKYEPVVLRSEDHARVRAICNALAAKEDILNILISNATEYRFQYAQKNCEERNMPAMKTVVTTIQGFDPYYTFQPKDAAHFGFSNVETTSNGLMVEICEDIFDGRELKSPMSTRSGAIWFTTNTSSEHCKSEDNAYCIHFQRGSSLGNNSYKIHTNEWMKVAVTGSRRGFFTERKLISSASCAGKEKFEKKAILK